MVLKENKKKADGKEEKTDSLNTPETDEQKNSDEGNSPEDKDDHKGVEDQLNEQKDKVLRLSAEFENFKKRKQREIDEFKKFANETVFRQLLSVVDNLERAIDSATDAVEETSLLEGVKLTHKEILKLFESFNVKRIEADNQPFDPNFHQAVTHAQDNDVPDNTVTNVLQKGYLLHDRLLRPAMVVVSKKVEEQAQEITKED
ncbi:nucleotide exchange factor GrpE [Desulfobacter hydrogenophilus]|uniref:Protein GrpE n=1 Tax=Desulfobacter hydrogenophilus TaxID=2291 RepID=A0A328FI20_9BACT|nr:nucleotide exchange factor GrpE [Desulfobacter hydrogenophilus]NDY71427.1 nucleotide exchange factor GrpE [Desulfobacter hydrogenophilus]QBH12167.1 nucleotide exchange factor GrpE [Desulfobacter hydrogenophilus]RAM03510.1 nucleotide exchange factor GrpE [Desulfobacter hydrogenophilus]